MERHSSSQIAKRSNDRDAGSDDTVMDFEEFMFVCQG